MYHPSPPHARPLPRPAAIIVRSYTGAFVRGHKGDKGVIKVHDKFGLQNNLLVMRINGNLHDSKIYDISEKVTVLQTYGSP